MLGTIIVWDSTGDSHVQKNMEHDVFMRWRSDVKDGSGILFNVKNGHTWIPAPHVVAIEWKFNDA